MYVCIGLCEMSEEHRRGLFKYKQNDCHADVWTVFVLVVTRNKTRK